MKNHVSLLPKGDCKENYQVIFWCWITVPGVNGERIQDSGIFTTFSDVFCLFFCFFCLDAFNMYKYLNTKLKDVWEKR